jgi:hypothetical protein
MPPDMWETNYHLSQHLFPSWLETSYFLFQCSLSFFPCAYIRVSNCFLYRFFYPLYNRCYLYCLRLQVCRVQFSILEGCLYTQCYHIPLLFVWLWVFNPRVQCLYACVFCFDTPASHLPFAGFVHLKWFPWRHAGFHVPQHLMNGSCTQLVRL